MKYFLKFAFLTFLITGGQFFLIMSLKVVLIGLGTVTLIEDGFYFRNRECSKESCTSLEQDLGLAIMPEGNLTMEVYRFDYFIYFAIFIKTCFQRVEFTKNVSTS